MKSELFIYGIVNVIENFNDEIRIWTHALRISAGDKICTAISSHIFRNYLYARKEAVDDRFSLWSTSLNELFEQFGISTVMETVVDSGVNEWISRIKSSLAQHSVDIAIISSEISGSDLVKEESQLMR